MPVDIRVVEDDHLEKNFYKSLTTSSSNITFLFPNPALVSKAFDKSCHCGHYI